MSVLNAMIRGLGLFGWKRNDERKIAEALFDSACSWHRAPTAEAAPPPSHVPTGHSITHKRREALLDSFVLRDFNSVYDIFTPASSLE